MSIEGHKGLREPERSCGPSRPIKEIRAHVQNYYRNKALIITKVTKKEPPTNYSKM